MCYVQNYLNAKLTPLIFYNCIQFINNPSDRKTPFYFEIMSDCTLSPVSVAHFVSTNMNHSEDTSLILTVSSNSTGNVSTQTSCHHRSVTVVPHRFDMH